MPPARQQRGAVTLIGALFIILVVTLLVQVINRMAGSAITATAAQNDSVEALFVAESGIEFASYRLANGTACVDLKTDVNTKGAGRGFFEVTDSFLAGTDCRVTIQGRVSSPGRAVPDAALRTVTADLRLASSGGWAVGDNGTILRLEGANWNSVATGTTRAFNGIYCATANDCWAVGNQTTGHWNGSSWAIQNNGFANLSSVACEPANPNYCVAVGSLFATSGFVYRWNGANWTITDFAFGRTYQDIACPSSTCYITATSGAIYRYDPGLTPRLDDDNSTTSISMNGIDCTSSTNCWAVGNRSGNDFNFNQRTSGGWAGDTLRANGDREHLYAVSCADASHCKAVGKSQGNKYTVVSFDGSNWSLESFPNSSNHADLNGVHCITANDCWAVGDVKSGWSIVHYDGVNWTYTGSPAANQENLNDVYISGSGGGGSAVTLIRWTEVVAN